MRHWSLTLLACVGSSLLIAFLMVFIESDIICGLLATCAIYAPTYSTPLIIIGGFIFDILNHAPPYRTMLLIITIHLTFYLNYRNLIAHNYLYKIKYGTTALGLIYAAYYLLRFTTISGAVIQLAVILTWHMVRRIAKGAYKHYSAE